MNSLFLLCQAISSHESGIGGVASTSPDIFPSGDNSVFVKTDKDLGICTPNIESSHSSGSPSSPMVVKVPSPRLNTHTRNYSPVSLSLPNSLPLPLQVNSNESPLSSVSPVRSRNALSIPILPLSFVPEVAYTDSARRSLDIPYLSARSDWSTARSTGGQEVSGKISPSGAAIYGAGADAGAGSASGVVGGAGGSSSRRTAPKRKLKTEPRYKSGSDRKQVDHRGLSSHRSAAHVDKIASLPGHLFSAFNAGDMDVVKDLVDQHTAETVLFSTKALHNPIAGRAHILSFFQALIDCHPDAHLLAHDMRLQDDSTLTSRIMFRGTKTVTSSKEFYFMKPGLVDNMNLSKFSEAEVLILKQQEADLLSRNCPIEVEFVGLLTMIFGDSLDGENEVAREGAAASAEGGVGGGGAGAGAGAGVWVKLKEGESRSPKLPVVSGIIIDFSLRTFKEAVILPSGEIV